MQMKPWSLASLGLLAALATVAATTSRLATLVHPGTRPAATTGNASLRAFGIRGTVPSLGVAATRLDAALNELVRHAGQVRASHELTDLHALHPAVRLRQVEGSGGPLVAVDAITRGDPQQLKSRLVALGMRGASVFSNDVGVGSPCRSYQRPQAAPKCTRSGPPCRAGASER